MESKPARLDIFRTRIPMRGFDHAAATRDVAEAIVVRLELTDGRSGWGETLPRPYVTGETIQSVVDDIENVLWPQYSREPESTLPDRTGERIITAAACALELAHLDANGTFGEPASGKSSIPTGVSGVLGSTDPDRTRKRLRLMRWFGLRDFKLKLALGDEIDFENLRIVHKSIGEAIARGKCTLRVDVNGGWDVDSVPERIAELKCYGVCVVEQPAYCSAGELVELAFRCELPLMADESLLTADDARTLLAEPKRIWWNIRISKNGGLTRAMKLARLGADNGVPLTVGCMVGETSILSAAQRRLLQSCPPPRFVEGNYGKFLLRDDLIGHSLRFGYAGRLRPLKGPGLGVSVDHTKLAKYGELLRTLVRISE